MVDHDSTHFSRKGDDTRIRSFKHSGMRKKGTLSEMLYTLRF